MDTNKSTDKTPATVYVFTDQPMTCPQCGARTEPVNEDGDERCLNKDCRFVFRAEVEDHS